MGIFDGKMWNWTRNDEKDAEAARRRAERRGAKAAADTAFADAIEGTSPNTVVRVNPKTGQGVADIAGSPRIKALQQSVKRLTKANEEQAEDIAELVDRLNRGEERLKDLVRTLRKGRQSDDDSASFMSAGVLSAVKGWISVINTGDKPQSLPALAAANAIGALVESDKLQGQQEQYARIMGLVLSAFAYYDTKAGLMSVLMANTSKGGGKAIAEVSTVVVEPDLTDTFLTDHGIS